MNSMQLINVINNHKRKSFAAHSLKTKNGNRISRHRFPLTLYSAFGSLVLKKSFTPLTPLLLKERIRSGSLIFFTHYLISI